MVAAHRWWSRHGRRPTQWCSGMGLGAATTRSVRDVVADGVGVAVLGRRGRGRHGVAGLGSCSVRKAQRRGGSSWPEAGGARRGAPSESRPTLLLLGGEVLGRRRGVAQTGVGVGVTVTTAGMDGDGGVVGCGGAKRWRSGSCSPR